jgi:hypothetical protein
MFNGVIPEPASGLCDNILYQLSFSAKDFLVDYLDSVNVVLNSELVQYGLSLPSYMPPEFQTTLNFGSTS